MCCVSTVFDYTVSIMLNVILLLTVYEINKLTVLDLQCDFILYSERVEPGV